MFIRMLKYKQEVTSVNLEPLYLDGRGAAEILNVLFIRMPSKFYISFQQNRRGLVLGFSPNLRPL